MESNKIESLLIERKNRFTPIKLYLGGTHYIFSNTMLAKHLQCIHSFEYDGKLMEEDYFYKEQDSYMVEGHCLKVEAMSFFSRGPAGDKGVLNVWLDGKQIGDHKAMISYIGGGMSGTYPSIITDGWQIIFWYDIIANKQGGRCSIDLYQTLFQLDKSSELHLSTAQVPDSTDKAYTLEEIEEIKRVYWTYPINESDTGEPIGILSLNEYPGFAEFHYSVTGVDRNILPEKVEIQNRIQKAQKGEFLKVLVFNTPTYNVRRIVSASRYIPLTTNQYLAMRHLH